MHWSYWITRRDHLMIQEQQITEDQDLYFLTISCCNSWSKVTVYRISSLAFILVLSHYSTCLFGLMLLHFMVPAFVTEKHMRSQNDTGMCCLFHTETCDEREIDMNEGRDLPSLGRQRIREQRTRVQPHTPTQLKSFSSSASSSYLFSSSQASFDMCVTERMSVLMKHVH